MRERVAAALEWSSARVLGVPRSTSRSCIGEALFEQKGLQRGDDGEILKKGTELMKMNANKMMRICGNLEGRARATKMA